MWTLKQIQIAVDKALKAGDGRSLGDCTHAIETLVMLNGTFDDQLFEWYLSVIESQEHISSDLSHVLLKAILDNWAELGDNQRNILIDVLDRSFPQYVDWMACFMVTEILGGCYHNEASLRVLQKHATIRNDDKRGLVAHGLGHLLTDGDLQTASQALETFWVLSKDISPEVQGEVQEALRITRSRFRRQPRPQIAELFEKRFGNSRGKSGA